jgi:hypothetical protein
VRAPFDDTAGKDLIGLGNIVGGGGQRATLAEIRRSTRCLSSPI